MAVTASVGAVWVVLRLLVFDSFTFPLTYVLPLLLVVWTGSVALLWLMAGAFAALHTLQQWVTLPADALPGGANWLMYAATMVNILAGAAAVHLVIDGRARLRKQAAEALRKSDARYRTLFDAIDEGFCIIEVLFDRDDTPVDYLFIETNPAFEKQTGLVHARGQRMRDLAPQHEEHWFQTYGRIALTGEPARFENRAEQLQRWYDVYAFRTGDPEERRVAVLFNDITARKQVEKALRDSEERLRLALSAAKGGGYAFDLPSQTLQMSSEAARVYGAPEGTRSLSKADALDLILPEDRHIPEAALQQAVATDGVYRAEYRIRLPDGRIRALASFGQFQPDSGRLVGLVMDVSERRASEDALRNSEQRLRALIHASSQVVYRMSPGWEEMLELQGGGFIADTAGTPKRDWLREYIHPDDQRRVLEAIEEAVRTGRVFELDHRVLRPDGRVGWTSSRAVPVRNAVGDVLEWFGAATDITDRTHAEQALRAANQALGEADRLKDEFIAVLSHELRNPLAPIRYALPLLERERLTEPAGKAVAVISRQVNHLVRLVDDLLDVSRITRGRIELQREYVTLGSIVDAAVEAASPALATARHALKTAVADEAVWLHADAARLTQVVTNLLNNSAKFTPRGGQITLEAGGEYGHAVIRVRDSGVGIPGDVLPTLFEMFHQGNGADRSRGGLGIGLGLARRLVEMHGGHIQAHSAGVGEGAEFVVRLPVARDMSVSVADPPSVRPRVLARRLKVLIVDDNADLVDMLGTVVASLGHDVRKAWNGESAISTARSYCPDVVLLDLGLPVMSGIEVARELRQQSETAHVRLVALTGWGQAEDRRRTSEAGFDHHLTKPTDPRVLEQLLATIATDRPS